MPKDALYAQVGCIDARSRSIVHAYVCSAPAWVTLHAVTIGAYAVQHPLLCCSYLVYCRACSTAKTASSRWALIGPRLTWSWCREVRFKMYTRKYAGLGIPVRHDAQMTVAAAGYLDYQDVEINLAFALLLVASSPNPPTMHRLLPPMHPPHRCRARSSPRPTLAGRRPGFGAPAGGWRPAAAEAAADDPRPPLLGPFCRNSSGACRIHGPCRISRI